MIPYRFLTPAEEEMTEAALFYEAASSQLGTDFLDDVQRAIDRVCDYPQAGEAITSNFRRTLLHQFPFSLIYTIEQNVIVIVAVAHQSRRPGYWQSRTNS
jgi:plasmid stabilization system protein ParE